MPRHLKDEPVLTGAKRSNLQETKEDLVRWEEEAAKIRERVAEVQRAAQALADQALTDASAWGRVAALESFVAEWGHVRPELLAGYRLLTTTPEIRRGHFDSAARLPELIEAMLPQSVPTPAIVLQARRNSVARTALIEEFGLLTGGQIAEINESAAENRAALASRWKQEGKIFSVTYRGATYYPAFQFAPGGRPRPVVARVLEALGDDGWETALWFTAANGYLEAARPVDLLETDPEAVVEAARKDVEVPY